MISRCRDAVAKRQPAGAARRYDSGGSQVSPVQPFRS
jgi:hypothetical protein